MIKEQLAAWKELNNRVESVIRSCENFNKPKPKLTYYEKLKDELDEHTACWGLFDEF